MDEVDDTRTTLAFVVKEVCQRHNPEAVAVAVLHNKDRPKLANLPESVNYFAGDVSSCSLFLSMLILSHDYAEESECRKGV